VVTLVSGYDEKRPVVIDDFRRAHLPLAPARQPADLLSGFAGWHSLHSGFFGKFLFVSSAAVGGGAIWLAIIRLLNSGAGCRRTICAWPWSRRNNRMRKSLLFPRLVSASAVGAALLLAVAATLVLELFRAMLLHAAEAAAYTLQAPSTETSARPLIPSI